MAEYQVNKGAGRKVEFKGLTSQYLYLFVGGLMGVFILFVGMHTAGLPQGICILTAVAAATLLVWGTFHLNRRYGPHGLQKLLSSRQHPRRIVHRRAVGRLLRMARTRRTVKP